MTPCSFRIQYPMFNEEAYPDAVVFRWLAFCELQISKKRWGNIYEQGLGLLTAHNLFLENKEMTAGGIEGLNAGVVNSISKSAGSVSKSYGYDIGATSLGGEGILNLTIWGKQFYRLSRMVTGGAGYAQ